MQGHFQDMQLTGTLHVDTTISLVDPFTQVNATWDENIVIQGYTKLAIKPIQEALSLSHKL